MGRVTSFLDILGGVRCVEEVIIRGGGLGWGVGL